MIVVSSRNGDVGLPAAMEALKAGGSALDAVEAGTRVVERNARDQTVGLGGLPNVLGEVRVDAQIMDGRTLRAGAVGSVRRIVHAVTLARLVMEDSPHVFLVGDGAERLAREVGLEEEDLLTTESREKWRAGLAQHSPDLDMEQLTECRDLRRVVAEMNASMAGWTEPKQHGTVNFIARDGNGDLATAVSTSGWAWGYPGRLGDSPAIGCGGYADNRWAAAASTGTGEVVLRTSACRSIALYMKMGMSLTEAVSEALSDLRDLDDPLVDHIAIIGLDADGNHVGLTHRPDERYAYLTDAMTEVTFADMVEAGGS